MFDSTSTLYKVMRVWSMKRQMDGDSKSIYLVTSELCPYIIRFRRADPKHVANSSRFLGHFDHPLLYQKKPHKSSSYAVLKDAYLQG